MSWQEDILKYARLAKAGDAAARRKVLDERGKEESLLKVLLKTVEERTERLCATYCFFLCGEDDEEWAATVGRLRDIRYELGGEDPPLLEQLLLDRILLSWLRLQVAEEEDLRLASPGARARPQELAAARKRLENADLLYHRSVSALAKTRKLLKPYSRVAFGTRPKKGSPEYKASVIADSPDW